MLKKYCYSIYSNVFFGLQNSIYNKIKYLLLGSVLLLFTTPVFAQLTGIKTVGTGKNYPTIAAAISALNSSGVGSGGVTFNVDANHTETFTTPTAGLITATGTAANKITFQKSGAGANPLITAGVGTTSSSSGVDGIIVIEGGDWITFDGIDVRENPTNNTDTRRMEWGYAILKSSITDGAKNVTIKNCSVTLNKINYETRGIYIENHTATSRTDLAVANVSGRHENITVLNNTISNASWGIYANSRKNAAYYDAALQITGNNVSDFLLYGICAQYQAAPAVRDNNIHSASNNVYQATYGIYILISSGTPVISGNSVSGLTHPWASGYIYGIYGFGSVSNNKVWNLTANGIEAQARVFGIYLTGASTASNNLIANLSAPNSVNTDAVNGIFALGGTTGVYHNTVYLNCSAGGEGFGSNALYANTGTTLTMRNNIFYNTSTAGTARAYKRSSNSLSGYQTASNNNLYYAGTPSANNLIFSDGTNNDQTFAEFRTRLANTRDNASLSEQLTFLNTTDGNNANFLRINTAFATYAESRGEKITDIDDDIDAVGSRASYPKGGQVNGGGTAPDLGAYEFDGIPVAEYSVGAGKTYTTIEAAIADLNAGVFSGKHVVFNVTAGHTETLTDRTGGRITATGSQQSPVIFRKSGAGANPRITAPRQVGINAVRDAIIIIEGGDYITFDGIDVQEHPDNATNNHRMEWGYAILKSSTTDGAKNITIKNCSVTLNKANPATSGIYINNHTASSTSQLNVNNISGRHENIVISNNVITNSFKGIGAFGRADAAFYDTGLLIENNSISDFGGAITTTFNCVELGNQAAPVIAGNTVTNGTTTGAYTLNGIAVAGCPNAVIKGNVMGNLTGALGVNGIYINADTYLLVAGNKIYGMATTGTGSGAEACGIRKASTSGAADIINNVIGGFSAPNSDRGQAQLGIYLTGNNTTMVNLFHNTVYLKATTVGVGGGSACVYANTAANLTMRNNIFYNASTVGVVKAFVRNNTSNLARYQTTSNNNLFYAGTPGANNLIYFDGTNSYQTISDFKNNMGGTRESQSISDTLTFLNTADGSNAAYLRINPNVNSAAESAGEPIAGFEDDFDAEGSRLVASYPKTWQTNGAGTNPDLGAHEFDGILKNALSGTYTVGTGKNYATIEAAIADLNAKGVGTGGVTFDVDAGHTETFATDSAGRITATGMALKPVIFQKSGAGVNPLITAPTGKGFLDGIIVIAGGDYITFNGIDLQEDTVNNNINAKRMEWGYALLNASETDGVKFVTIKNCNITLNKANTATRGIYVQNHTYISNTNLIITELSGRHDNNAFLNNTISNTNSGIYCYHGSENVTTPTLFTISGNTIDNFALYGIYLYAPTAMLINTNTIRNAAGGSSARGISMDRVMPPTSTVSDNTVHDITASSVAYGFYWYGNGGSITATGNKTYNITATGATASTVAYGMYCNAIITLANNIIGNIQAPASTKTDYPVQGIYLSYGTAYHNTVYLNCTSSAPAFTSAAIYATSVLTLRNNILINNSADGKKVAFYYSAALSSYNTTSNNNLFYAGTPSANNLIFSDGTNNDQTFTDFRTRLANFRDNQSLSEAVTFLNTTTGSNAGFLRPDPATATNIESAGVKITGFDDDIDNVGIRATYPQSGQTRGWGIAPDLGAAEFDGTRVPVITSFTPTTAGVGRIVTIYGKNFRGLSGAAAVKFSVLNAMSYTVVNDTTIRAEVGTGTSGSVSVTTPGGTATQAGFTYSNTLNGTYTVGTGKDYATIANAITALNAATLGGHVIFNVDANHTETFPTATAGNISTTQGAANKTITFQKSGAGANPLITAPTGIGAVDYIIQINGADWITFNGIDLQENAANSIDVHRMERGYAIMRQSSTNGAKNIVIKNCEITLNKENTNLTYGIYAAGTNAANNFGRNENLTIDSNGIANVQNGIWIEGTNNASYYEPNLQIRGNTVSDFAQHGIYAQYQVSPLVQGNSISSGTGSGAVYGIRFVSLSGAPDISGNSISGLTSTGSTANGIYSAGSAGAAIKGNSISGLTSTGGTVYGIYSNASTLIEGNKVSGLSSATGNSYGIYGFGTISKNKVWNSDALTAASGIFITSGTSVVSNNMVAGINASSNNNDAVNGIYVNAVADLYHNTVYINATGGGGKNAVYAANVNHTFRNNIFYNASTTGTARAYRRSGTNLTYYQNASNNNLFYAGTPSANNLIYSDGTNSSQTLAAYKAIATLSPRDQNSLSETLTFLNTTDGNNPNFLRLSPTVATNIESAGAQIIDDDIDNTGIRAASNYPQSGQTRGWGIAPDLGAAEFDGMRTPTITNFTPTSAAQGATVTITGTNFRNISGAAGVKFGGVNAASYTVVNETTITATVATGASGSVTVTTATGGTATRAGFTFIPAPTISGFTPTSAGQGTTVTITGTNFTGATAVKFGGTNATSYTVVSATSITAVVASGTTGTISVTTAGGTTTSSGTFTYVPAPTITSFTPTSAGQGQSVTITGTNFTGATAVKFGGTNATSYNVVNATSITAVVAAGTTGTVSVTTAGGTGTLAGFTHSNALSGTYTVGTGKQYATIANAIIALNNSSIGGAITFNVDAGHTETFSSATAGNITATGTATNTITFQKSGAGANPLITAPTGTGFTDYIIQIFGGDYITFNGIDLQEDTVNNNTAAQRMEYGYYIARAAGGANGAKNITIKNCAVTLNKANTSATYGIYAAGTNATNAAGRNDSLTIDSNTISNVRNGINVLGTSSYPEPNLQIRGNTINNFGMYGIWMQDQQSPLADKNKVINGSGNAQLRGVVAQACTAPAIKRNIVKGLSTTGATHWVDGIWIYLGSGAVVSNNMVSDLTATISTNVNCINGISLEGDASVYHNTVYLSCSTGGTGFASNAMYVGNGNAATLRNNIFYNVSTYGSARAYRRNSAPLSYYQSASNNNLFYAGTPSANNLIFFDGTNSSQTLAQFRTYLNDSRDNQSLSEPLTFLEVADGNSANFLRLDPTVATNIESAGAQIINDDIDNIGIRAASNYPQGSQTRGYGFAPDLGAAEFDGFRASLNGTYTVGTGKQIPRIAAAIRALNYSGVSGAVTFNIDANHAETFTSPTAGRITATGTATNTITFQKSGAGANPLITAGTGTSTALDAIIVIEGGDYITFDAIDVQEDTVNNGNDDQRMEWGYAILKKDETDAAKNITIKNCAITLNKAAGGVVKIGVNINNHRVNSNGQLTISGASGRHSNISILNNTMNNVHYGVFARGANNAGFDDQNLQLTGNAVNNYADRGLYVWYQNAPLISQNTITNGNYAGVMCGIFSANNTAPRIERNTISGLTGTGTATVFGIYSEESSNITLAGNSIENVLNNAAIDAIRATTGSGSLLIENNRIFNLHSTGTSIEVCGIRKQTGATNTTISNNLIGNFSAVYSTSGAALHGVYVQGGTINVYHNTVYLKADALGTNGGSICLYHNTGANLTLRNNIFYNASTVGASRAYRTSSASIANYNAASNNNLFYAGAQGLVFSSNAVGWSDTTLAMFRTRLGDNRDNASLNETLTFLNTTDGNHPDFLRPAAGNYKLGANIAGFETDIENTLRSTPPDIGAYEGREANRWIGGASTVWSAITNWDNGIVPSNNASVLIDSLSTNSPQLTADLNVTDVTLPQGKFIDINGQHLTINGNLIGGGKLKSSSASSLTINGTGTLNLAFEDASSNIKDLTINRGTSQATGTVTLQSNLSIINALTVNNGTFNSNNQLTLLSNALGTARVGSIPSTADVIGHVTVQRYIPAIMRRSRMLSSPVQNFTFAQLIDDIFITGPGGVSNGFDASPQNGVTVHLYQQDTAGGRGWKGIGSINAPLPAGVGCVAFVRGDRTLQNWHTSPYPAQNEVTLTFKNQPLNKGTISPVLTNSNTGEVENDGWNLVGNPYASPIDWKKVSKSNISPFYYSYNVQTGSYVVGTGDTLIATGQAFFIKATGANPSITFTETSKAVNAPASYFKSAPQQLKLHMIKDAFNADELTIAFSSNASNNYHVMEDALKLTNAAVNVATVVNNDSLLLQYNSHGAISSTSDTIKLYADAANGNYTFLFDEISTINSAYEVYLHDAFISSITNLRTTNSYTFNITNDNTSKGKERFKLVFSKGGSLPVQLISFTGNKNSTDVLLSWVTSNEKNSHSFVVQKSFGDGNWQDIGSVKAKGNTATNTLYGYTDKEALLNAEQVFYRLKQMDQNGSYSYSQAVSIYEGKYITELNIYPVPAQQYIHIESTNHVQSDVLIELVDVTGKVIKHQMYNQESHTITIDLKELNAGVYMLRYTINGITVTKKIVKQ